MLMCDVWNRKMLKILGVICVLLSVVAAESADFDIVRFGAKPDGTKSTTAFASAFAAAELAGGGRVLVPQGRWVTGAVRLRSNCELHLCDGATVEFTDDLSDYLPGVPVAIEGIECCNVSPLVYAYGCTNVAITGTGTLKAKMDFWWAWGGPRKPACEVVNRRLKDEWSPKNIPIGERQLWKQPNAEFRPQFLHFNRCKGVRLEGFSMRGSPFWTIHTFLCDGVSVRGLDVNAAGDDGRMINNSDGFDIEATKNVHIENCTFCQGDDAFVLKSGKDFDGRRLATPTENVVVRNCRVRKAHNLAAIGSELSGGVRNIHISDCRVDGSVLDLLHVKTNPRRGGYVENILVENVQADELRRSVLSVTARYYFGSVGEEAFADDFLTPIRDIEIRNVKCRKAPRRVDLHGDYLLPVERVTLEGVMVEKMTGRDYVASVKDLCINGESVPPSVTLLTSCALSCTNDASIVWQPETREYLKVFTDGTVWGTVLRRSRNRLLWSESVPAFCPESEFENKKVDSATLRRMPDGWYLDVVFESVSRTYFTPEIFWPFRPKSYFGTK